MNGVLILAHGSRKKDTEETFEKIVRMAAEKVDVAVESAYMEFSEKNIEKGLGNLLQKGVTHVKIVPYFLFSGMHIHKDIPEEVEAFLKGRPGVTYEMGKTLGTDPRLAEILVDRIAE